MAAKVTVFYNGVRDIDFDIVDRAGVTHIVHINGSGAGLKGPNAQPLPLAGAFGITPNVDADEWAEVVKLYGQMPIFKNGLIKAASDAKETEAAKAQVSSVDNGNGPADKGDAGTKKARNLKK